MPTIKAKRFRHMAIDNDDTPVSARLLNIANELDARAEEIDVGQAAPSSRRQKQAP
jgi:hypothetical protein